MENKKNDTVKKVWIVIVLAIMITIALIWVFEKGKALGISVSR